MATHMLVDGIRVNADLLDVRVVAACLKVDDGRMWMTQLVWDPDAGRFYFSCGEPRVDLGLPGVSADIRLSLDRDTARRRLVGPRFAFLWASEHGVPVEKVEEVTGLDCPKFPGVPKPDDPGVGL